MLVQVVLELAEHPVGDREGVADIGRQRIALGQMPDRVDGIADRLMLLIELGEGVSDRCHIQGIRRNAGCSGGVDPLDGWKEHLFLLPEMGRHVGGDPGEDGGDFDHLGMVGAVDPGNLVGVGGNLRGVLVEIGVVRIDDVIGEKRQGPGRIVLAPLDWRAFRLGNLPLQRGQLEPFFPADRGEGLPPQQKSMPWPSKTLAVRKSSATIAPTVASEEGIICSLADFFMVFLLGLTRPLVNVFTIPA